MKSIRSYFRVNEKARCMNRRRFLATSTTVGATAVTAGCTRSGSSPEDTTTTTEQPTTTQGSPRPEIVATSLLSRWDEFGDVSSYRVDAVGEGAYAIIGFRYDVMVHGGTLDVTDQVKVFDPSGERVAIKDTRDEQLTEGDGLQTWENAFYFDTTSWERGEYTYEVLIRDNVSDKVSGTKQGSFTVNAPLGESEATLAAVDDPDTVSVGEPYSFTLTFENTSSRDGSVVTPLSARYESQDSWRTYSSGQIPATMAAGETNTWESAELSFDYEGAFQFRLDDLGEIWSVEVTA